MGMSDEVDVVEALLNGLPKVTVVDSGEEGVITVGVAIVNVELEDGSVSLTYRSDTLGGAEALGLLQLEADRMRKIWEEEGEGE